MDAETTAYAIETRSLHVRLVQLSGRSVDGTIFLRAVSHRRPGPETLIERLNHEETRFLPLELEQIELINLDWISYLEVEGRAPEVEEAEQLGMERSPAEIELISRELFKGELIYLLPEGRNRVSDFLNLSADRFFLFQSEGFTRYVNRHALVRVRV
ncbi:MAG: hypothetical protein D6696_06940 [Acidobacteria bacterium]|nr:MAG: hypothetical protein D6696_06940 [Acidobacteriota bacterium]